MSSEGLIRFFLRAGSGEKNVRILSTVFFFLYIFNRFRLHASKISMLNLLIGHLKVFIPQIISVCVWTMNERFSNITLALQISRSGVGTTNPLAAEINLLLGIDNLSSNRRVPLDVKSRIRIQCFGSGKKYYGSESDLKIISQIRIRIRIRILLEIILYCFTEVYINLLT